MPAHGQPYRLWAYGAPRIATIFEGESYRTERFDNHVSHLLVEQRTTVDDVPLRAMFKFQMDPYGVPLLMRVTVEGMLRDPTTGELVESTATNVVQPLTASMLRRAVNIGGAEDVATRYIRSLNDPLRPSRSPSRHVTRQKVVRLYRDALDNQASNPYTAVQLQTGYSRSHIKNLISEARRLGELSEQRSKP